MKLPPNTRLVKDGRYIEFRKQYKGKTVALSFPVAKEKQALEEIYKILGKINRNENIFELEERRITMVQAADTFWERHAKKKTEEGCDGFPSYIARIKEFFGTAWFDAITNEEVEAFLTWLKETPFKHPRHKNTPAKQLAIGTVNLHHKCLVSIFKKIPIWARLGKIVNVKLPKQGNPASLVDKESEEGCIRTRVLSLAELEQLVLAATPRAGKIIAALFFTLLRYNDLRQAKTEPENPQNALRGIQGKTGNGYEIATNSFTIGKLDFTNFPAEFEAAKKKANIINHLQVRDIRRSGATHLFRETNDLGMVQQRLGHKSPDTTRKYLGILDSDNIRASEVLGAILSRIQAAKQAHNIIEGQLVDPNKKVCLGCKELKPLEAYGRHSAVKSGLNSWCRICNYQRLVEQRKRNPDIRLKEYANNRPVSSVVERLTHIQEAASSILAPGTISSEAA